MKQEQTIDKDKPIIENAYQLAVEVAEAIQTRCYMAPNRPIVDEIMLFGSCVRGEPAHDIDLLLIHDSLDLAEMGLISKYDKTKRKMKPIDDMVNLETSKLSSEFVFGRLGSPKIGCFINFEQDLRYEIENAESPRQTWEEFQAGVFPRPKKKARINISGRYIEIDVTGPYDEVKERIQKVITEEKSKGVLDRVNKIMKAKDFSIDSVLDIHIMYQSVLKTPPAWDMTDYSEERRLAVIQCKDRTYWQTIFTEGRLFDASKRDFSIPVAERFLQVLEFFEPTQYANELHKETK